MYLAYPCCSPWPSAGMPVAYMISLWLERRVVARDLKAKGASLVRTPEQERALVAASRQASNKTLSGACALPISLLCPHRPFLSEVLPIPNLNAKSYEPT